jgi:hypothetical protein
VAYEATILRLIADYGEINFWALAYTDLTGQSPLQFRPA